MIDEFIVLPVLCNAVFRDDEDAIRIADCSQPVCDDECRPVFCQFSKRLLDDPFRLGIESGRRFIQNEDGWIFQEHPRNGKPLLLTAGKFQAAFPNLCFIAIW